MKPHLKLLLTASLLVSTVVHAELPPQVYEELREKAPEFLKIEVLSSKQEVDVDASPPPKGSKLLLIHLTATVLEVDRSKSNLKKGDVISIDYTRTERPKGTGWVGPSEIPILAKGEVTDAYLSKTEKTGAYSPAARGQSFHTLKE